MSAEGMYGYEESTGSGLSFGGNFGNAYLKKFEFTANGGKDGAEADAVDIVFEVNGTEKSYRKFPVTRAFDEGVEITDPNHAKFKEAVKDFNKIMTHIVGTFVEKTDLQAALATPIKSFKQYINVLASLLPKDYADIKLDIFAQYQWQITGSNTRTFLEFPKKMTAGPWLVQSVSPAGGTWKEVRTETSLKYVDEEGNTHPFVRNEWFVKSNYANPQFEEDGEGQASEMNAGSGDAPKKKW